VDIEINGEPVDLHMKLGDNGEAFFVEESEELEGSIASYLCTSPICKERSLNHPIPPSNGPEVTGAGAILRKRRRQRRRSKKDVLLDWDSDSDDETESEMTIKKPCELPAPSTSSLSFLLCSDAACSSFAEETVSLQPREVHPYSDGELLAVDSFTPSHQSSPKSDSELEIKPQKGFALGVESHLKWIWGKLPQCYVELLHPTFTMKVVLSASYLRIISKPPPQILQDFSAQDFPYALFRSVSVHISTGGSSVLPREHQSQSDHSSSPKLPPCTERSCLPFAARLCGTAGKGWRAACPGSNAWESWAQHVESIKSPHVGPSAIYVEDLSKLDSKPVALYFHRSDTEQSLRPVTDSSNPLCIQLPSTLPASSPVDSDSMPTVALSLCGGLRGNRQISLEKFMEHMISYQQFAENPRLISDPNLVIMINKKYYNWEVAGPIVLALQAFQRNIPESIIDELVKEKMPKRDRRSCFFWRRRELPTEGVCLQHFVKTLADPFPSLCRQEEKESPSDNQLLNPGDVLAVKASAQKPLPTYKKSLRLSSEQIGKLNLQDGPNEVAFSVTTQYQGTCRCEATIYLWNWNEKVVISDIDGTITKSDALGHILPQLGKDWTHRGIVKLFHKIHLNGYKFLYCSARAIGMADITKGYLKWVNEQGCGLPMGPMLLSPSSLFSAFHRHVIEKKPEVFKVTCLTDIRKLFATKSPFYAAFGNRPNDVYAYKQVGLPESRIFTVNPKGELIQELRKDQKSTYERLLELVEVLFPPV
ncbi:LPIN3 phosphatase, partial [Erythrocercus mccallii]|nr:LPIN3 phosphatase [Erythrocercus mccallii]